MKPSINPRRGRRPSHLNYRVWDFGRSALSAGVAPWFWATGLLIVDALIAIASGPIQQSLGRGTGFMRRVPRKKS